MSLIPTTFHTEDAIPGHPFWMVELKGDAFQMGLDPTDPDAFGDENPVHSVSVKDFLLGQVPVTQGLWEVVMGDNPSYFTGTNRPVEQVSWKDTQRFLEFLQTKTGKAYRLPTEAEWEYAARGRNKSRRYKYAGSDKLSEVAWFSDNSHWETKPVGLKYPNELGLHDMSGNVWEWVEDQ